MGADYSYISVGSKTNIILYFGQNSGGEGSGVYICACSSHGYGE